MEHHFNVEVATKYGIFIAIFLNHLAFWIQKNQANNRNFHDGKYWSYNSYEALTEIFPYWSTDQIKRLVKKCLQLGLIIKANFNKNKYDQTNWYALTDFSIQLLNFPIRRNRPIEAVESPNEKDEIAQPIPDNYTDNKTDLKSSCRNDQKINISNNASFEDNFKNRKTKKQLQEENAKQHTFAESMNKNATEKKQLEAHEERKQKEIQSSKRINTTASANTEWGPGHPSYDAKHGVKRNEEHQEGNQSRGNSMRKAKDYLF